MTASVTLPQIKEVYQWDVDFDPWSEEPEPNRHQVEKLEEQGLEGKIDTSEDECSAAPPPDFENLVAEPKCDSV